jgi:hypothetical protein
MMPNLRIVSAGAIIIIIMLVAICIDANTQHDKGVYGMWAADAKFMEKAGLDSLYIYITPPKGNADSRICMTGTTCPVYVVIKSGGITKHNGMVKTSIRRTSIMPNCVATYKANFGKEIDILPRRVSMKVDHVNNMLVLYSKNTMYAKLFKKPESSFYCKVQSDDQQSADSDSDSDSDDDTE